MKTIILAFLFSTLALAEVNIKDVQQSSFYTGCIDGWIVTYEAGWYVRPKGMTGHDVFKKLKKDCAKKADLYRKEQEAFEITPSKGELPR
jgi:hypothetical protein